MKRSTYGVTVWNHALGEHADFIAEVDAKLETDQASGIYGISFLMSGSGDSHRFVVDTNGRYRLGGLAYDYC